MEEINWYEPTSLDAGSKLMMASASRSRASLFLDEREAATVRLVLRESIPAWSRMGAQICVDRISELEAAINWIAQA